MGITHFHVPQPDRLTPEAVRQCYMQGIEEVPWLSNNVLEGSLLSIQRDATESGNLFVPWPVTGRGRMTLSTTCLRESEQPYHLPVELARGTVGRMRNQVELWKHVGVPVSAEILQRVQLATRALGRAATNQSNVASSAAAAEEAIGEALDAIDLMVLSFSDFSLERAGKRNVFLGANLGARTGRAFPNELLGAINTAVVPCSWSEAEHSGSDGEVDHSADQVRWCRKLGLRVCAGPLLDFGENGLPDWLYLWEEDPDSLQSYMLRYVESTVARFAGKVNLWHAWCGLNNGQAMNLSEEFRLRVGVGAIETLRKHDPNTPVFVSFRQPFGEYLSRHALDLAPIHYADTLVRADLGITGFGLEINLGYSPHGTLPRDLLDISRMVDRWSTFGLPLVILLTIPSAPSDDPKCRTVAFGDPELTAESQARLTEEIVRTCLAKQVVQGVIWNQLYDGDSPSFPHGGLFTQDQSAKPVLDALRSVRQRFLT